jgi:hypothetical protein
MNASKLRKSMQMDMSKDPANERNGHESFEDGRDEKDSDSMPEANGYAQEIQRKEWKWIILR